MAIEALFNFGGLIKILKIIKLKPPSNKSPILYGCTLHIIKTCLHDTTNLSLVLIEEMFKKRCDLYCG